MTNNFVTASRIGTCSLIAQLRLHCAAVHPQMCAVSAQPIHFLHWKNISHDGQLIETTRCLFEVLSNSTSHFHYPTFKFWPISLPFCGMHESVVWFLLRNSRETPKLEDPTDFRKPSESFKSAGLLPYINSRTRKLSSIELARTRKDTRRRTCRRPERAIVQFSRMAERSSIVLACRMIYLINLNEPRKHCKSMEPPCSVE